MRVMFVGGLPSELIGLLKFRSFGQVEELEPEQVRNAARGGCAILPADDPAAAAFTAAELEERASFGSHASAPAEFREKVRAARVRAAEFAEEMERAYHAALEAEVKRG